MSTTNELDLKNDIQVEEDVGQSAIQGYLGEYGKFLKIAYTFFSAMNYGISLSL